nr:oligoendopeptidase F [Planococcus sp. (in: firmicutes)]
MVKSLPARSAVPVEETWDLSSLFSSSEEFDQALESLEQDADALSKKAQGTIVDASSAIQALTDYVAFLEKLVPLSTYASLTISTDQTNNEVQLQSSKFGAAAA